MYNIERKNFGYKLLFGGLIDASEMKQWVEDSKKELAEGPAEFGVFVDMRTLKPLAPDVQKHMEEGQKLYKMKGMTRSVVILDNSITKLQFKRIAKETGIYEWERYIDASSADNWEKLGVDWITSAVDPDKLEEASA